MEKFIDRESEMKTLEKEYAKKQSSFVVVYGRRRVGKTTLLTRFLQNKPALYYLVTQESEIINMKLFQEKVCEFTQNDLLKEVTVDRWDTLFKAVISKKWEEKPIIVIDEFQYLGKMNSAFPSVLQRIWDEILRTENVMVILCGSLISMMVSQTLSYDSPLYGRRTAQIRLKQIPFVYYHEFYHDRSLQELVERYAVTGGVPKYIESFDDDMDIYESIQQNILDKSSYLYEEPYFLLQHEVKEVGTYFSILRAIAFGNRKMSQIAALLEVSPSDLSRPLKTLMDLDLVEREVPVTEKNTEKSKKGLYRITDQYINFWFTFIYPNQSDLEQGNTEYVLQKIEKSFVRNHVAFVYEDICRERLAKQNLTSFHFTKYGRHWDKNTEIDIVGINEEENQILFGECKYWSNKVDVDIYYDLKEKASKVSWSNQKRKEIFVLFSIHGFTDELLELQKKESDLILLS